MHFDTALNLLWFFLGVVALGSTIRAAVRQRDNANSSPWLHVVGVALIVAALFPYISATDDLVRSQVFTAQQDPDHSSSSKKSPNDSLIRLYEILDAPLVCSTCVLTLTFFAIWVIFLPATKRDGRAAPPCAGRSPPLLFGL